MERERVCTYREPKAFYTQKKASAIYMMLWSWKLLHSHEMKQQVRNWGGGGGGRRRRRRRRRREAILIMVFFFSSSSSFLLTIGSDVQGVTEAQEPSSGMNESIFHTGLFCSEGKNFSLSLTISHNTMRFLWLKVIDFGHVVWGFSCWKWLILVVWGFSCWKLSITCFIKYDASYYCNLSLGTGGLGLFCLWA